MLSLVIALISEILNPVKQENKKRASIFFKIGFIKLVKVQVIIKETD